MSLAVTIASVVVSLHFGRIFAGNVYRCMVAYIVPAEALAQKLGYTLPPVLVTEEDGKTYERSEADVARITFLERTKFFLHSLLAS